MEDGNLIVGLKTIKKTIDLLIWDKKKHLLETLITLVILCGFHVWGFSISKDLWRNTKHIQNNIITYNLKIKGNTPYPLYSQK